MSWDKSACIKVLLDVTKPLRRILKLRNSKGNVVVVEVKYERLLIFFYVCGHVGHINVTVRWHQRKIEVYVDKQWGMWLRALSRRRRVQMDEEAKTFLKCSKVLVFDKPKAMREAMDDIGEDKNVLLNKGESNTTLIVEAQFVEPARPLTQNIATSPVSHNSSFCFSIGSGTSSKNGKNKLMKMKRGELVGMLVVEFLLW